MLTARRLNFIRKAMILGFVVFVLVAVFSCGMLQTLSSHGGVDVVKCDAIAPLIGGVSIRDFALYSALFAIVVSLMIVLDRRMYKKVSAPVLSLSVMSAGQFRQQNQLLFNFLIEAFRRGIIH